MRLHLFLLGVAIVAHATTPRLQARTNVEGMIPKETSLSQKRWNVHAAWLKDPKTRFHAGLAFSANAIVTLAMLLTVLVAWTVRPDLLFCALMALFCQVGILAKNFFDVHGPGSHHFCLVFQLIVWVCVWSSTRPHPSKMSQNSAEASRFVASTWLAIYATYAFVYSVIYYMIK